MDASHLPAPRLQARENAVHRPAAPIAPAFIDLTASDDNEDEEAVGARPRQAQRFDNNSFRPRHQRSVTTPRRPAAAGRNMASHASPSSREPEGPRNPGFQNPQPRQNPTPSLEAPLPNLQHRPQNPPGPAQAINMVPDDVWGDLFLKGENDEEAFFRALAEVEPQMSSFQPPSARSNPPAAPLARQPSAAETRDACVGTIMMIFPGIDPDHVSELYDTVSPSSDQLTVHILDMVEKGIQYPKAKDKKNLKRKRDIDEDEAAAKKYGAVHRVITAGPGSVRPYIRYILMQEFPVTPATFIDATLNQNQFRLFSAYRILEEAHRTYNSIPPPYTKIRNPRKTEPLLREDAILPFLVQPSLDPRKAEVLKELQACRRIKKKADAAREVERQKELDEEENFRKSEAEGTMAECGCCFCDYPLNRMVHCDGSEDIHWFCRGCARMMAEVEIGKSKYELRCMSMDKCEAGFAMDQRVQFLDEKTRVALERNEQESNLRLAGIENLESCPFCPFAAEYPSVEVDREFRCQAEDCERVSCRLCKLDSHIPKSCEEVAKESGLSIRRQIEEAMSEALIRKCNKCGTPFVKDEGCNKMVCTRNGCRNVQCYVCSKSCGYDHFNDRARGGKAGNCPLFESVEQRHEDEVKKAEKEALDKVLADHPEYTAEDLKLEMSDKVKEDDARRKANDPRARADAMMARLGRMPPPVPLGVNLNWHPMGLQPVPVVYRPPGMQQRPAMPQPPGMPQPVMGAYGPFAGIPRPQALALGQLPEDPFGAAANARRREQMHQHLYQVPGFHAVLNVMPAPPVPNPPPGPVIRPPTAPRQGIAQVVRQRAIVGGANNQNSDRVVVALARADAARAANNANANGGAGPLGLDAALDGLVDFFGDRGEDEDHRLDNNIANWYFENEREVGNDWL